MEEETGKFLIEDDDSQSHPNEKTNIPRGVINSNLSNYSPDITYKDHKADLSPFGGTRKTYIQRTFGPMKQGSVRGSILALCAVAIGSGVLSLPYVLAQNGWVLGTLLIIIGAVSGYFSMYMILQRSIENKCKNFSELAQLAGGRPLTILLQISILSFMFGACVSYQIIITKLFVITCNNFGVSPDVTGNPSSGITLFKSLQAIITTICFIFPLSLAKNMSALRYISLVSIASIVYTLIVMLVELPEYWQKYYSPEVMSYFDLNINFFDGCSITFFSFTCQASILPIYSELVSPSQKRMTKVIGRSLIVDCIFYCSIALVGYFSTFNLTPELVIARPQLWDKDYAMTISCIAVILVVLVSSPANFFPFKNTLNFMITGGYEVSWKMNVICTSIFCACTCGLSIVFPKIKSALSLTGGFSSVMMCYLVPLICWLKLSKDKWYTPQNLAFIIFFMTLSLIGWTSVIITIVHIIQGKT